MISDYSYGFTKSPMYLYDSYVQDWYEDYEGDEVPEADGDRRPDLPPDRSRQADSPDEDGSGQGVPGSVPDPPRASAGSSPSHGPEELPQPPISGTKEQPVDEMSVDDAFIMSVLRGWRLLQAAGLSAEEKRDILFLGQPRIVLTTRSSPVPCRLSGMSSYLVIVLRLIIRTMPCTRTRTSSTTRMRLGMMAPEIGGTISLTTRTAKMTGGKITGRRQNRRQCLWPTLSQKNLLKILRLVKPSRRRR